MTDREGSNRFSGQPTLPAPKPVRKHRCRPDPQDPQIIRPLTTGDMAYLPFGEIAFDVVVSGLAIHNIKGRAGQAAAIDEGPVLPKLSQDAR